MRLTDDEGVKPPPALQRVGDAGIPMGNGVDKWASEGGVNQADSLQ